MWSTSVLGAEQLGHWQEGWAWRVRVRREAQGALSEGWAWSHRVCAEGARVVWAGHRDDPEGVRREHPGWVHLVGGMVGVMAPAYATGRGARNCGPHHTARRPDARRGRDLVQRDPRHPATASRAPAYISLPFFFTLSLLSLSLSIRKKVVVSRRGTFRRDSADSGPARFNPGTGFEAAERVYGGDWAAWFIATTEITPPEILLPRPIEGRSGGLVARTLKSFGVFARFT